MLDFNLLLREAGFDPAAVVVMRHKPAEPALRRVLGWLVVDNPELFRAYQQVQFAVAESMMSRAELMVSFVGQEAGRATFAGLYRIGDSRRLDRAGYLAFPGHAELMAFGMSGMAGEAREPLAFDLTRMPTFEAWIGHLVIDWPRPERAWIRWADRGIFNVHAISEENRFERGMPHWNELVLTWRELSALPPSWREALAQWRGIYLIFDSVLEKGYVGSAGGAENLLGRWRGYADTGHGGNKQLRDRQPQDLVFSILERTSPDLPSEELVRIENRWKERLQTRTHGLNLN